MDRRHCGGWHRIVLVQWRHQLHVIAVEHALRYGLRPGIFLLRRAEIGGGVPQQVLVEVAAGHAPAALFVLRLHIRQQQRQLLRGDGTVTGVGREVQVVEHQLTAAGDGDTADGVAAVQVQKLHKAGLHRQLYAVGCGDIRRREGQQAGPGGSVGSGQGIQKIGRVIILAENAALVEEGGVIEWVSGSFGSHVGCLYPMSILKGDNSRMEFTGVTFAGKGQNLDTGAKVVHVGKNTSSYMNTRSISKGGGISTFRSSVVVEKSAKGTKSSVSCQSLMLDSQSRSDTIPAMDIRTKDAAVGHEAKIGSISNEAVFYLMSRGMSEEDARALIVSGFADNVSKELPVEYAVEMNNLIRLEMKGSIG